VCVCVCVCAIAVYYKFNARTTTAKTHVADAEHLIRGDDKSASFQSASAASTGVSTDFAVRFNFLSHVQNCKTQ